MTAISTEFADRVNQNKTNALVEDKPSELHMQPIATVELDKFFSPAFWALGSDSLDGIVWTIERQLERHNVVKGSVRLITELDRDSCVRITMVFIKQ